MNKNKLLHHETRVYNTIYKSLVKYVRWSFKTIKADFFYFYKKIQFFFIGTAYNLIKQVVHFFTCFS